MGEPAASKGFLDRLYAWINGGFDGIEESNRVAAAREAAIPRPRLHWSFEIGGAPHILELTRKLWDARYRLVIDGTPAGQAHRPGIRHPRAETIGRIGESELVVVLERRRDWAEHLRVDVFVGGISLTDGQTLERSREAAAAPKPRQSMLERYGPSVPDLIPNAAFIESDSLLVGCLTWVVGIVVVVVGALVLLTVVDVLLLLGGWFVGVVVVGVRSRARGLLSANRVRAFVFLSGIVVLTLIGIWILRRSR